MTVILPAAQADQIRRAHKARSWKQLTLARKAGIDRGVVLRAENMHPIEATNLRLLADVLEADANDLLGHAEVPPPSLPAAKASATRTALMALLDFLDDSQQEALLQHLRYEWRPTTVARPSVVVSRR